MGVLCIWRWLALKAYWSVQYADFSWKQSMSLIQTIYCTCRNVCGVGAHVITKQAIPEWTASTSENVHKGRRT